MMDEVYRNGKVSLIIINDSVQKWDWREFYFVQIWQISCYATTKRNKVPQNPYSSDLFVMVTLYSYRKKMCASQCTWKITPPFKIKQNYRSVTLVLSIKYLAHCVHWALSICVRGIKHCFIGRKAIVYVRNGSIYFYRFISPFIFKFQDFGVVVFLSK